MSRSKAAAAAERGVKASTSRHVNLFWPPAIWIIMWAAAEGIYLVFHYVLPTYRDWVVLFSTLSLGALCGLVFLQARPRIANRRDSHAIRGMIYATGTAIACSFWMLFGMIGNPLSPGLMVAWGFGAVIVVAWIIRMIMERTDAQAHADGRPSRRDAANALAESLTGDKQIEAAVGNHTDEMIDIHLDLTESDMDQNGLRGVGQKLAAAYGVPAHSGVIIPDPAHAGKVTARVMLKDIHAEPLPWPGPTEPGGTPFSPIVKGRYITGEPAKLWVADGDGVRQNCRVGMPRSGKGNGSLVEMGNAITWRETSLAVIDIRKGFQLVEPLIPAIDWMIIDRDTARKLLSAAMDRVLQGRFRRLGALGEPVWRPGLGMQFWWVQVEEASFLELPDEYVERIGKSAGSAGVHIEWSLQSSIHTEMSTTLRRMFSTWEVYGTQDEFENKNLPEELIAAGVDPSKWRDEKPGMNYTSGKGIPRFMQATELRDFKPRRDQLAELAATWGPQPLDQFTADLLGPLYHHRPNPVVMLAAERQRAMGGPAPAAAAVSVQVDHGVDTALSGGGVAVLERPYDAVNDDGDGDGGVMERDPVIDGMKPEELGVTVDYEGIDVDLSYRDAMRLPLPDGPDVPIGDPADRGVPGYRPTEESVAWMRAQVDAQIDLWEAEGKQWVRPADFVNTELHGPLGPETRSRAYFAKEIQNRLVPAGRLQKRDEDTGAYMIIPQAGPAGPASADQ